MTHNENFLEQKANNSTSKICPNCGIRHFVEIVDFDNLSLVYISCEKRYFGRYFKESQSHRSVTYKLTDEIANTLIESSKVKPVDFFTNEL